jgi:hypothetical protein
MFLIALIFSCFFVFRLLELFFTLADFYNYLVEENMFVINMFAYIIFNIVILAGLVWLAFYIGGKF